MDRDHTVKAFDADLKQLHGAIVDMGRLAERQLESAMAAVLAADTDAAARVVAGDEEIDRLERRVETMAVRLLALRHPMAKDLREVVAALKIATNMERMGDFAAGLARRAVVLKLLPVQPPVRSLGRMGQTVVAMVRDVTDAYAAQDVAAALGVRDSDGEVDAAYTSLFRELLTYMMETPSQIGGCTHMIFMAKALERIGDHATNVAENICFLVDGHIPGDERIKKDLTSFTVLKPEAAGPDEPSSGG